MKYQTIRSLFLLSQFLLSLFLLSLFLVGSYVHADNELFPFVISFDPAENITSVAATLDAPAGKHGFVRVQDGHFVTDQGRIQFWGTNTCFGANFLDHEAADRMADRMARFGINCVRLHHMDSHDIWGGANAKSKMKFDPAQLERLDYYIAALKKRGIYVNINLHVSRSLDERDGFPKDQHRPNHDKGIDNYYRPFIEANKLYAKELLEHVNPYTKTAYKDEPAVAMIEINNENSIITMWGGWGGLDQIRDPFLADLKSEWNTWLKKKYGSDKKLEQAWKCRSEPLGPSVFQDADFEKGYVPNGKRWNWEVDPKVDASAKNNGSALLLDVRKKGEVNWHPQLVGTGFAVKKNQLYTLKIKARANQSTQLSVALNMNHDPWNGLGFSNTIDLDSQWKVFQFNVIPSKDDENARIAIGSFSEGVSYEIQSVSFQTGGEVRLPSEPALGLNMIAKGDFPKGFLPDGKAWVWETDKKVQAELSNEDHALRIDLKKKGEVSWHPQLLAVALDVKKTQTYTLSFTARADREAPLSVNLAMNHEPWNGLGFNRDQKCTTRWQTFTYTIKPQADDSNARISFAGFDENTVYEIKQVSFRPGTPGEDKPTSLAQGNIPVVWKKDAGLYSQETMDDFCDFLMDIEARYWDEMFSYLKKELKVRQPVSGTQLEYGSTHAQARMDYCDIHAYWNHPHFPGRPWDGNNWYLHNRALVNYFDRHILTNLASKRVYNMPFTVSEYNHPYPNSYAGEGLPLLAAFGAFQDWDGFFPFAYSHSRYVEPQHAGSFFDTAGNTVQMAHMIACHQMFCKGTNSDAKKTMRIVPMTFEQERELFKKHRGPYAFGFTGLGQDARQALLTPTAVDVHGKVKQASEMSMIPKDQKRFEVSGGKGPTAFKWIYDLEKAGKGYIVADNPGGTLFTGFVEPGKDYPFKDGQIQFGETNLGWATVSLAKLNKGYLLVLTGQMLNTDMKIEPLEDDRITVGNRWGKAPVRCEGIPATITWKGRSKTLTCWALDPSGNRKEKVEVHQKNNLFTIKPDPKYQTIWYEIEE